jgi:GGDEF domain-containing protein
VARKRSGAASPPPHARRRARGVGIGPLRVSAGFALFPHDARGPQQLLAKADAAAVEAKRVDRAERRAAA